MEILLAKAKQIVTKDWVYGYPVKHLDGSMTIFSNETLDIFTVISETLCYSTGEKDKDGRELFIGDTINDFGGGVLKIDHEHPDYHPTMACPPYKRTGDITRLGNIVMEDGTVRIQTAEMAYCYNLSAGSKLSDMQYVSNVWDSVYE